MSQKHERSLESLKNESARQRWELFHRAIASAKQSNTRAMQEEQDGTAAESAATATEQRNEPQLSIAR
ncbi:MAG TPA: hypothetical protein VF200_10640 [Woeseiaceae bacterium]